MPAFTVRTATADEIIDLRHRMLRQGLPREAAKFEIDANPHTLHAAALASDVVVGCATFTPCPLDTEPAWQLRGMAVDGAWQNAGLGRAVLAFMEGQLRDRSVTLLWCNARTPAVPFYQRQGWRVISDEFHIPTAGPHFRMRKDL
ncbi:MAG TPA: GNAT family N-acetyltransferase [Tepidisphaeraceae bacterium]|jgi:GNAT superfamily N-acetyltransferase|nr:GNAT family N-acetyltransferase [Tepidisphaeraceae bacterium]